MRRSEVAAWLAAAARPIVLDSTPFQVVVTAPLSELAEAAVAAVEVVAWLQMVRWRVTQLVSDRRSRWPARWPVRRPQTKRRLAAPASPSKMCAFHETSLSLVLKKEAS